MARISTHVLDITRGTPAQGIAVELHLVKGAERRLIAAVTTNADGRTEQPLISGDQLETGIYELSFHAADYFHRLGVTLTDPPFMGVIVIRIGVASSAGNYHVPLLRFALRLQHVSRIMTSIEQAREVIRWCRQLAKLSEDRDATTRTFLSKTDARRPHGARRVDGAHGNDRARGRHRKHPRRLPVRGFADAAVRRAAAFTSARIWTPFPMPARSTECLAWCWRSRWSSCSATKRFPFAIEVVGFSDEEGVRFGAPFLGSHALAGTFDQRRCSIDRPAGKTLRDAIREFRPGPQPYS